VRSLLAACALGLTALAGCTEPSLAQAVGSAPLGPAGQKGLEWGEAQKLTTPEGTGGAYFGHALALSGDTAVVGAPGQRIGSNHMQGTVHIFAREADGFREVERLTAPDGAALDDFGSHVALVGDWLAVGAPGADVGGRADQGAVYVFAREAGAWSLRQKVVASDGAAGDRFGAVALEADTLAVGAHGCDLGGQADQGAAYVFFREAGVFGEQQKLSAPSGAAEDFFGASLALSGDTLVVGAPGDDSAHPSQGAVYAFVRSAGAWSLQRKLVTGDGAAWDRFGGSLALEGDLLAGGAPGANAGQGAVYLYLRAAGLWNLHRKLSASDGAADDRFGVSLALDGERVAIGAFQVEVGPNANQGAAYIFQRVSGVWGQRQRLVAADGSSQDMLGIAVALEGPTLLAGAEGDAIGPNNNQGSAYVFVERYALGDACTQPDQCLSGACVDGVCCDGDCGGGDPEDCQACAIARGGTTDGVCGPLSAARPVICRPSAGACDLAESCTTTSTDCPPDAVVAAGTPCRDPAGPCDQEETCTGWNPLCPDDSFLPATTLCRQSAGACDPEERCTGAAAACPEDLLSPAGSVCRAEAGACDLAELCAGTRPDCPLDRFAAAGVPCRAAAGPCDQEETCTGAAAACPADSFQPNTFVCRPAAGACDQPEACTGAAADCPADARLPPGALCREAAGACDKPEHCDGAAPGCPPDAWVEAGTPCRPAAGWCDLPEACTGTSAECPADSFRPATHDCRPAAGACDAPERCNGSSADCPPDALLPAHEACRPGACTAGVESDPAFCTGVNADCPTSAVRSCAPFACGAETCLAACATAADCLAGHRCEAGACVSGGAQGDPCLTAAECDSGFCADGRCCDAACAGQCEACDLAGSLGTCGPVAGAPHGDRTPCTSDGSACGGACDGVLRPACAYPGSSVPCREASCTDAVAVLAATCQGNGACPAEQTQRCAPAECDGDRCGGGCALDTDCQAGQYCAAGVCTNKLAQGESCAGPPQCLSGFCTDGVCCDGDCGDQCEACDAAGAEGTCVPVTGAPHGGRAACAGTGVCQGSCDGEAREACAFPGADAICSSPSCRLEGFTPAGACDGQGACRAPEAVSCGPYACAEGACLTSCQSDADCAGGHECADGACRLFEAASGCGCGLDRPSLTSDLTATLGAGLVLVGLAFIRRRRR
jgi:hypothetical protein